jgi:hypothetical protein
MQNLAAVMPELGTITVKDVGQQRGDVASGAGS